MSLFHLSSGQFLKVDTTQFIEWRESRKLTWDDYKLVKTKTTKSAALTTVTHSVRGGLEEGKPNFQVKVLYVKAKSWTNTKESDWLLEHEVLHFDLAELYGRRIRRQIHVMGKNGVTDLSEYRRKIRLIIAQFKRKSRDYDRQTAHGTIAEKQAEWKIYVESEMQRLHENM